MDPAARVLEELRADPDFMAGVSHWEVIPARSAQTEELPEDLDSRLRGALEGRGISALYTHQAQSFAAVNSGRDVVVVTPTASGKTLSYNLPVLQQILQAPESRALYLFPTKALSQDQQSELNESIVFGELPVKVATYDGDTPTSVRASARETGQIIITNPDMLHAGVLPNHPRWIKFLKNLRFVVIDELHTYRGIFGSHVANVMRRLRRIARFYGVDPVFICCSATIGNPKELAELVVGRPMELIDQNGAPSGEKHLVLYNPPLVDPVQGIRRSTVHVSRDMALRFLRSGVRTIVFARSRQRVELIASYIRKALANVYTDNSRITVESYRGGYLPNERRAIEKGLRDGSIHGVVSTNALELGIDIGGLDAAVLAGFPGSIASSWQQAGRAGRRQTLSIAVVVGSSGPLDQYLMRHPEYFLSRSPERGFVDPDNMYVKTDHLKCAVFELPFSNLQEEELEFPEPAEYLAVLEEEGTIRRAQDRWYWADRGYPAEGISLRSAASDNVVIVDTTDGRNEVIGEMDRPSAKELLFINAIYIHRGAQFVVQLLDLENRRAEVEAVKVDYWTDAQVKRDIKVLIEDERVPLAGVETVLGDVLVRSQVSKFKKLRFTTHENIGYGEVNLPEEELHTRALVSVFSKGTAARSALDALPDGASGPVIARLGRVLQNVAPVFLLSDPRDIGIAERVRDPHFGEPALFLFDQYPGGSGLSERLRTVLPDLLAAAAELVERCPCESGCPSCVGPVDPERDIGVDPKASVGQLLDAWRSGGRSA